MISRVYVRICMVSHSLFLCFFFFLFFESCNRISRVRCSPSFVACARHRASAGKVLELKPSVALTKSNNAMFHVRCLSRACFPSAQSFDTFFQRTYDASAPSYFSSLSFLCVSSSSSSSLSSSLLDAISLGFSPTLYNADQRHSPLNSIKVYLLIFDRGRTQLLPTGSSCVAST